MVRKVHKYANGGQIKDYNTTEYRWPKPTYGQAVKDRVKKVLGIDAGRAAIKREQDRPSVRDKIIDDMSG